MTEFGLKLLQHRETQKHNRADEDIRRTTNKNTRDHNEVMEGIERDKVDETIRSNFANEEIKRDTLDETKRSNEVNEGIKRDTLNETIDENQRRNRQHYSKLTNDAEIAKGNNIASAYSADQKLLGKLPFGLGNLYSTLVNELGVSKTRNAIVNTSASNWGITGNFRGHGASGKF